MSIDFFSNIFPKTNALDITGIIEDIRLNFPFYCDVEVNNDRELKQVAVWSIENLGGVSDNLSRWCLCEFPAGSRFETWIFRFYFKFEEDQIAFKLRWI